MAFILVANFKDSLPAFLLWIADPNIAGFLSFGLGATGMVVGSLLTQKISPPKDITRYFEKGD